MTKALYPNPKLVDVETEKKETPRRWLSSRQTVIYLGLKSMRALEGYVRRKQLIPYKPFGRLLFDLFELDRLVVASRK